jgi:hypothetical protein
LRALHASGLTANEDLTTMEGVGVRTSAGLLIGVVLGALDAVVA